jgi:hypothetical protein
MTGRNLNEEQRALTVQVDPLSARWGLIRGGVGKVSDESLQSDGTSCCRFTPGGLPIVARSLPDVVDQRATCFV